MKGRIGYVFSALLLAAGTVVAQEIAMETLRENLAAYLRDPLLDAPVAPGEVPREMPPPFSGDGTWEDVDYASRRSSDWPAKLHLRRLHVLAKNRDADAANQALAAWIRLDPQSDNWWNQSIGTPKSLCETMILLGEDLDPALRTSIRPLLDRSKPGMTGQNRTWLAGIHVMKGILYGDETAIRQGRSILLSELRIVPAGKEGLQGDFTYHQHGPQMQLGNYGLGFFREMTRWGVAFEGTPFELPASRKDLLEHFFLEALRWPMYRGSLDLSACGRQLVGDFPATKYRSILAGARALQRVGRLEGFDFQTVDGLVGSRYFPRSAYLVHRRPGWYFSVRMCAPDLIGAETVNNENLLGKFTADGATFFRTHGGEYDGVPPLWDWRRIPGTTELYREKEDLRAGGFRNQGPGASASGEAGEDGTASAKLCLRVDGLRADKEWRCTPDGVEAIGSNIASDVDAPVITTMDQRRLLGPVLAIRDGIATPIPEGDEVLPLPVRIVHDGVEYDVRSADGVLHVIQETRTGGWHRMNAARPVTPMEGRVLTLLIDHGVRPSNAGYRYILRPAAEVH
ncbi:MAG: polysaccharide lyase family 8 super-sandwich domain-containing protein [Kiritimatiellia bacterium]